MNAAARQQIVAAGNHAAAGRFSPAISVSDEPSFYSPDAVARDLMMPAGEPAGALIAAGLLLGMIWFAGAYGDGAGGSKATHAAATARHPMLQSDGGAVRRPPASRSAG